MQTQRVSVKKETQNVVISIEWKRNKSEISINEKKKGRSSFSSFYRGVDDDVLHNNNKRTANER